MGPEGQNGCEQENIATVAKCIKDINVEYDPNAVATDVVFEAAADKAELNCTPTMKLTLLFGVWLV